MVTKWGLSNKLGPLTYGEDEGEVFLGREMTRRKEVSEQTANAIDEEVREIIDRNYQRAKRILEEHRDKLEIMAQTLMQYETIGDLQIKAIMAGKKPPPPEGWEEPKPPEITPKDPDSAIGIQASDGSKNSTSASDKSTTASGKEDLV